MKQIEVESKTVEEAIAQGLDTLGLSLEEVSIDILEEGSKGIFGFIGVKQAKVRLTVGEEETDDKPAAPVRTQAAPPAQPTPVAPIAPTAPVQRESAPAKPKPINPQPQTAPAPSAAPVRAEVKVQPRSATPPAERPRSAPPRPEAGAERERARAARREEEARTPLEPGEADATREFLLDVSAKMGVDVTIDPVEREGMLCFDILGDEKGVLIGHRGETLDALQYITGLVHNKNRQIYRRVQLDSQNYRKKRQETLVRLAFRLADKACRTGRRVTLEPMNPYERRVLHSALQGNQNVTTHSEGDEPNRRVVIVPK